MSWIETTQGIITLISSGIVLIGAICGLGINLYKAMKQVIKNKDWGTIIKIADAAMTAAEQSGKSGADKKKLVIEAVEKSCKELNISFDFEQLSNYIDECIEFANKINSKQ